jgi:hypothetical protein
MIGIWNRLTLERKIATAYLSVSLLSVAGIAAFGQSAIIDGINGSATGDEIVKEIWMLFLMAVVANAMLWVWPTAVVPLFLPFVRRLALPGFVWAILAVDFVVSNVMYRHPLLVFLSGLALAGVLACGLAVSWVRDRGSEHGWRFSRWQREPVGAGFRRIHVLAAAVHTVVILPLVSLDEWWRPVITLPTLVAVVYVVRRTLRDVNSRATVT